MKLRIITSLCVVALLTAVVAGTSAAAPVFYTKGVVGGTAAAVPFTATAGALLYEPTNGSKFTCKAGEESGEVTGSTTVANVTAVFTGCEASGFKCTSAGEAEGTIQLEQLAGSLGSLTTTLPGLRLFSQAAGKGGVFAEFSCAGGAIGVVWRGSIVGSLSGANGENAAEGDFASSDKLTFAEAKGIQKYTTFLTGEGEAGNEQLEENSNGAGYEKVGWSDIWTITSVPAGNLGFTE